jgi:hypothetical protein
MAIVYTPNQQLTKHDLNIFIRDENNQMFDPHYIAAQLVDSDGNSIYINDIITPERNSQGWYWLNIIIPNEVSVGSYTVNWFVQDTEQSSLQQIQQKFAIIKNHNQLFHKYS